MNQITAAIRAIRRAWCDWRLTRAEDELEHQKSLYATGPWYIANTEDHIQSLRILRARLED